MLENDPKAKGIWAEPVTVDFPKENQGYLLRYCVFKKFTLLFSMFFSMTFLKIYEVNFLEPSSWSVRIRWWDEKGRQVSRRNIFILIKISSRNLASLFYFICISKCVWPLSRYLDKQIINDFENLSFSWKMIFSSFTSTYPLRQTNVCLSLSESKRRFRDRSYKR